jgi:hypothetical protein
MSLLLQKHRELQVVTPRNLAEFRGAVLVLPNVSVLGEDEKAKLRQFVSNGGRLVITGADSTGFGEITGVKRFAECPGKAYFDQLQKDFVAGSAADPKEFVSSLDANAEISVDAPPTVISNITSVDGAPHIFFANFTALVPHKIAVPAEQRAVRISTPAGKYKVLRVLPFLGEVQSVQSQLVGDRDVFTLPSLVRGAVAWFADEGPVH